MSDKKGYLHFGSDLRPDGAFVTKDAGLYEGETRPEVNGLRVRCTGDEAARPGIALMVGRHDEEKLRRWAEEHRE